MTNMTNDKYDKMTIDKILQNDKYNQMAKMTIGICQYDKIFVYSMFENI